MLSRQEFFSLMRAESVTSCSTEQMYSAYEVYRTCPEIQMSGFTFEGIAGKGCYRCGECCRKPWRIEVSFSDVLRWVSEGRSDILGSLEFYPRKNACEASSPEGSMTLLKHAGMQIPELGDDIASDAAFKLFISALYDGCLVLPKNKNGCVYLMAGAATSCSIHGTKPEVCIRFPNFK